MNVSLNLISPVLRTSNNRKASVNIWATMYAKNTYKKLNFKNAPTMTNTKKCYWEKHVLKVNFLLDPTKTS